MPEKITIARLAEAGGVGVETVRYYQRRGLLRVPKPSAGAFRTYDSADVDRLVFIRRAQAAGFSLEEIAELLQLDQSRDRKRVRELAQERLRALDMKIADLHAAKTALAKLVGHCETSRSGPCPIIEAFATASARRAADCE